MPKFPSVHAWAKFPKLIARGINDLSVKTVSLVIRALRSIQKSGNRQVTAKIIRNMWTRNPLAILCTTYLFVSIPGPSSFLSRIFLMKNPPRAIARGRKDKLDERLSCFVPRNFQKTFHGIKSPKSRFAISGDGVSQILGRTKKYSRKKRDYLAKPLK